MSDEVSTIRVDDLIKTRNFKNTIQTKEYRAFGRLPIVDQSNRAVCGYTDKTEYSYPFELPVIVFGDHTLVTKFVDFPFAAGADGTQILVPLSSNDETRYIYYVLLKTTMEMTSDGYKRHFSILKQCTVPYIRTAGSQKKIAAILTAVDDVIEKTEAQIRKLEDLKKATMNELLTKGIGHTEFKNSPVGRIPKSWEVMTISDSPIQVLDGDRGKHYPKESEFFRSGYCLFLSAKNVTKSGFRFSERSFVSKKRDELLRKGRLFRGDIVITTRGTVGNVAYYDESVLYDVIRINSGMAILRNNDDSIDNRYLFGLMRSSVITRQVELLTFGSAQPQLTIGVIESLKLPIPPPEEQQRIAATVLSGDRVIDDTQRKLHRLKYLKKALMQDLLTGKVRVPLN